MISKILMRWKAREEEWKNRRIEQEEKDKAKEVELLKQRIEKMTNLYCPIMDDVCRIDCVHFNKGFVSYYFEDMNCKRYYHVNPSCKLWGK